VTTGKKSGSPNSKDRDGDENECGVFGVVLYGGCVNSVG
tara:strand:+ start:286 stop:402 length:117 start_codon:yes stop_codon:yes gene_type:complete